jgi:hypothetical protein
MMTPKFLSRGYGLMTLTFLAGFIAGQAIWYILHP